MQIRARIGALDVNVLRKHAHYVFHKEKGLTRAKVVS